jgi:uncharacterized membrane protein
VIGRNDSLNDSLVEEYLAQVSRATAALPQVRRDELICDLREHIQTSRADLPAETETEAQVREILEQLGDPENIAQAAAEGGDLPPGEPSPAGIAPGASRSRGLRLALVAAAVVVVVVLILMICLGTLFFSNDSTGGSGM